MANSFPFDILIASPNTAIDSYYGLDHLAMPGVNRCRSVFHTAGGKGLNMARAATRLGAHPLCTGFLGGSAGQFIAAELEREGIQHNMLFIDQESRRCSTIYVEGEQDTTVFLEPGSSLDAEDEEALCDHIEKLAPQAHFTALTGSLPPGFRPDFYARVVRIAKAKQGRVCVDCNGEALAAAASAGPEIIKVNRQEFSQSFRLDAQADLLTAIRAQFAELSQAGVHILIVTDGPRGAMVFSRNEKPFLVNTPVDQVISTAGAGDTFFAGLLFRLAQGEDLVSAARFASAAAVVSVRELGCGFLDAALVEAYLDRSRIEALAEQS